MSLGAIIDRLILYGFDEHGDPIPKRPRGMYEVRCKETRAYVNITHLSAREEAESRAERDRRHDAAIEELTAEERSVLRMQGKLVVRSEVRRTILAGDYVRAQRKGFQLIPGTERTVDIGSGGWAEIGATITDPETGKPFTDEGDNVVREAGRVHPGEGTPKAAAVLDVVGYEDIQVEALDYRQIAEELGRTVNQVREIVKSAHKKIRAKLGGGNR